MSDTQPLSAARPGKSGASTTNAATGKAAAPAKPRRWAGELTPGETIDDQVFLVRKKDLRSTTSGGLYIHMILVDRTGQLLTRVWQATQAQFDSIPEGGFLRVRGRTESYKGALQFIVDGMRSVKQAEVELSEFIPRSQRDPEEMWQQVLAILRTVENKHVKLLIAEFVNDAAIADRFKQAPAAVSLHHAYLGGLVEHTLSLLTLATLIFGRENARDSHYPKLSRDLILAGIFLHDIGKTVELSYGTSFDYTDSGQLIGHVVQAAIWIDQKAGEVEARTGEPFPPDVQTVLTHIVLAHHGTYEFGSPKLPAVPEAVAVHHLDNLDSKIHQFLHQIESDHSGESRWTSYIPALATRLFKPDVLGIRPADGSAAAAAPAD